MGAWLDGDIENICLWWNIPPHILLHCNRSKDMLKNPIILYYQTKKFKTDQRWSLLNISRATKIGFCIELHFLVNFLIKLIILVAPTGKLLLWINLRILRSWPSKQAPPIQLNFLENVTFLAHLMCYCYQKLEKLVIFIEIRLLLGLNRPLPWPTLGLSQSEAEM